ncbi:hypothetical protein [Bifidobacterium longum]|uniref:hypothetical protein n=1 Tax=Bifidobacterium longum TaxID=216816 RepID=UPI002902176A|nr:hypothetical protein [Bifidobacterium longum]MDU2950451.1 hypothetical protein [Bifidobacterium longum]
MISTYDWFIARCKAVINHSRPPEPPMRVRLHEAGHAVAGHRFGYVQQGIMLCIGWWAVGVALSPRQRADIDVYGLMGGFILTCVFAWIMDRRQTAGKETFPKLRDQIADFAVEYIASESYRKNKDKEDEIGRPAYVSGEAACNTVDIATALGGGFHVSFPPGRGTMTLIKYFPDGSDVSIEVGDDRAAASNSRFETVEWDIEDGIPQKLVDMLHPKAG